MTYFKEDISETVWDIKYRYRYREKIKDKTIEDTWRRVAKSAAKVESLKERKNWENQFYQMLEGFVFLPGGRILAGAGTKHAVTLFNCFVIPILTDSLPGIFNAIKEGALTLQQGGGVGYDFSCLRPNGSLIKKIDSPASGPVSFMKIWNAMCATMLSTGARRGAMMGVLRCDHPDIEEFIRAKSDPKELRHFNVSVLVTDEFMQAVKENREWELVFPEVYPDINQQSIERRWCGEIRSCQVFKRIHARTLWEKIIRSAYDYAEPGVLFEDTINRMNNLWYREWISTTNPCGEIPLPSYGACNLGSLNITQFVIEPFSNHAEMNWNKIEKVTSLATRFLDNMVDVSKYPLKEERKEAFATRRIGLGLTGLGSALVMLGIRYGSPESLALASRLMKLISETTWKTSIQLAKEKGSFSAFHAEKYGQGNFVKQLPEDIQRDIQNNGMRNSHHNTIAPAGTISLLANNISNGLEPIFGGRYERTIRLVNGELMKFSVRDFAFRNDDIKNSSAWMDSQSLQPEDHLKIQHAVQPFIDNAISKTINLPENFPFEKLNAVYTQAYEYGLKGCTIFRPNPVTGSVLKTETLDDRCCKS